MLNRTYCALAILVLLIASAANSAEGVRLKAVDQNSRLIAAANVGSSFTPASEAPQLTSVSDNYAVFFARQDDGTVKQVVIKNLKPDTAYQRFGTSFRTLPRPKGKLLSTFVTVNDIHIGEQICGFDSKHPLLGPILRNEPGRTPYAEMMSREAVDEIAALNPGAVLAKGDLTDAGKPEDLQMFLAIWGKLGDKFHWVLGNHDVHSSRLATAPQMVRVDIAGVTLAMLDTSIDGKPNGQVTSEQLAWLDKIASSADRPVLVFGHHHVWLPGSERTPSYFGINPDDSDKLIALFHRYPRLAGYFCGHTHSNRVRYADDLPGVPFAEVAAVKEFPGAFAEYRVYEGGIQQIMHRINSPECLKWTEKTLQTEEGQYGQHHFGTISDRCFVFVPGEKISLKAGGTGGGLCSEAARSTPALPGRSDSVGRDFGEQSPSAPWRRIGPIAMNLSP